MKPDFAKMALIPAVMQDARSGEVLMLAYMNEESYDATVASGFATFYSRTRRRLWTKGETSGAKLKVVGLSLDCDRDAVLIRVEPQGPVCHRGTAACFDPLVTPGASSFGVLEQLEERVRSRLAAAAANSYSWQLVTAGSARLGQKIGEEGVELALAVAARDRQATAEEAADLLFHATVALLEAGLSWAVVAECLERRRSPRDVE